MGNHALFNLLNKEHTVDLSFVKVTISAQKFIEGLDSETADVILSQLQLEALSDLQPQFGVVSTKKDDSKLELGVYLNAANDEYPEICHLSDILSYLDGVDLRSLIAAKQGIKEILLKIDNMEKEEVKRLNE